MFGNAAGPGFLGSHRGPENSDHGSAHEGHATQNEQIEKERGEDAGAVHDPVLAQISAEGQVLCGSLESQSLGACGHEQRQSHERRADPGPQQQRHGAPARQRFIAERVTDGQVALEAQRGDVEDRGIAAGLEQKAVDPAGGVCGRGREGEPDGAVELHGHPDEQHQQIGAGQTQHIVRHALLQVSAPLQPLGHVDGGAVSHDAQHEDEAVEHGEEDLHLLTRLQCFPEALHFLVLLHDAGRSLVDFSAVYLCR